MRLPSNWFDQQLIGIKYLIVLIHQPNVFMSPRDCTVSQPFTFLNDRIPAWLLCCSSWLGFLFTAQPYFECPSRVNVLEYNSFYTKFHNHRTHRKENQQRNSKRSTSVPDCLTTLPLFVFTWWKDFLKISGKCVG